MNLKLNVEYIHPNDLRIDGSYQRQTDLRRANRMAENFRIEQLDPLRVSRREDGSLWVWDGGHRLAMARILGAAKVPCLVYSMSFVGEAEAFAEAQTSRRGLSSLDAFRARLAGGDTESLDIQKILDERGLRVAAGQGEGRVACISKLRRIHDAGLLGTTADLLVLLGWLDKPKGSDSNIWGGLARFLGRATTQPGAEFDQDRLVSILVHRHPGGFLAPYGPGHRFDLGVSLHIADVYNRGIRNPARRINVQG